jgi:hypothetical protein
MNDSHDELLKAFRQYFEANQRWINDQTRVAGKEMRWWLSEIRRICTKRRAEVQEWRHDVDAQKAKKKATQNELVGKDINTN